MGYYSELGQNLRRRGCEEDQVLTVLHEVRDTTKEVGQTPEAEFGTPEEQTAKFSGKRARSRGQATLNLFGFAGICYMVFCAVWPELFDFTNPVVRNFGGMIALLILLIVGAVVAGFLDTRVPKEFMD